MTVTTDISDVRKITKTLSMAMYADDNVIDVFVAEYFKGYKSSHSVSFVVEDYQNPNYSEK